MCSSDLFSERLYRYVVEMHDTTARAYGMPTQADFHRAVALREAAAAQAEKPAEKPTTERPQRRLRAVSDPDADTGRPAAAGE